MILPQAIRLRVRGTVQGVGFRPFVYRIARRHQLVGWVCNDARGVDIFVQGAPSNLADFSNALTVEAPPLTKIEEIQSYPADLADPPNIAFEIRTSIYGEQPLVDIARDTTPCPACIAELNDPNNRRYRHPFINCTDCGPRYTIIQQMPYDRPHTTMAEFDLCPDCRCEYTDPADRRFHAQPVCCPNCGPELSAPLSNVISAINAGKIVAIKGLGGFHLCCRADLPETVQKLRDRKGRAARPFALMAHNIKAARTYAEISLREQELLESIERPIVILTAKPNHRCVEGVAPGVNTLGIILPYTPLHELLFADGEFDALIMTSGNRSGEPLCKDNDEAVTQLSSIADEFLLHNRPIEMRLDDSVVRLLDNEPVLLRRARGYVPAPLPAPFDVDGIIALGGIMKSTICIGRKQTAYVSQYLGTLENTETVDHAANVLDHLKSVLGVTPNQYVMDLHPGGFQKYLLPETVSNNVILVQHHHAHAAACMAENRLQGRALCIVFDGLGMGDDGTLWGGEFLLSDYHSSERVGHLELLDLPGGDAATEFPGRIAYTALSGLVDPQELDAAFDWMPEREHLKNLTNQPRTSSMGRLFDALSALLGICRQQTYEGQAAIELECIADENPVDGYSLPRRHGDTENQTSAPPCLRGEKIILPSKALLKAAFEDVQHGAPKAVIATKFHRTIARWIAEFAALSGEPQVCLCGGCFQNALLVSATREELLKRDIVPFVHRRLSPGDESISYGQLVTAAARRSAEKGEEKKSCV